MAFAVSPPSGRAVLDEIGSSGRNRPVPGNEVPDYAASALALLLQDGSAQRVEEARQRLAMSFDDEEADFPLDEVIAHEQEAMEEFAAASEREPLLPETPEKIRRRFRSKQSPVGTAHAGVSTPSTGSSSAEADCRSRSPKPSASHLRKARTLFALHFAKGNQTGDAKGWTEKFCEGSKQFRMQSPAIKQEWIDKSLFDPEAGQVAMVSKSKKREDGVPPDESSKEYAAGMLFTWNHPWLLDDPAWVDLCREHKEEPDRLVCLAKEHAGLKKIFSALVEVCQSICKQFRCRHFSCCVECSLEATDVGRIHLHSFIERNCREDNAWSKWSSIRAVFTVLAVPPAHAQVSGGKSRGRGRERAMLEGHYYCQAPKFGHLLHESTCKVWQDIFPVVRMVLHLWVKRKMSHEAARSECLLSRDKVPQTIGLLEATMSLEYSAHMEHEATMALRNWKPLPFKEPTPMELEWVRQFACVACRPHLSRSRAVNYCTSEDLVVSYGLQRFRFLIYDGPSRMGKTELALAWWGAQHTLVVNAQDTKTPNLRPLQSGKFTAVLYDEGNWSLCASQKLLFQASTRRIELGQSQCNDRCYDIMVFRVPMIICSNDFWNGCNDDKIRDWIEENSFFVSITEKVFGAPRTSFTNV